MTSRTFCPTMTSDWGWRMVATVLQLLALALVLAGSTLLGGVPGMLVGLGVVVGYVGLAAERHGGDG